MMDKVLKKRLVGTAVIVALAVIFVPMLLEGPAEKAEDVSMKISIPPRPSYDIPNRLAKADSAVVPPQVGETQPLKEASAEPVSEPSSKVPEKIESASKQASVEKEPGNVSENKSPEKVAEKPSEPKEKVVKVLAAAKPELEKPEDKAPAKQIDTNTSASGFVIQVGSFSSQSNANGLAKRLKAAGYPAFVESSKLKTSSIFRVKVGPKPSRKQANQLRVELIDEEKLEGIIVRHP